MGESYTFRGYLRNALYQQVWQWAHKKHPKWGKRSIAKAYFMGEDQRALNRNITKNCNFYRRVRGNRRNIKTEGGIT